MVEGLRAPKGTHRATFSTMGAPNTLIEIVIERPRVSFDVFFGFGGHLPCIHGAVLENPPIPFLPNIPKRVDYHPVHLLFVACKLLS